MVNRTREEEQNRLRLFPDAEIAQAVSAIRFPWLEEQTQETARQEPLKYSRARLAVQDLQELDARNCWAEIDALTQRASFDGRPDYAEMVVARVQSAMAQLTYLDGSELEAYLDPLGFDVVPIEQDGVEAFVAMHRETGAIFVSFRGTDADRDGDMERNFDMWHRADHPDVDNLRGHRGYTNALFQDDIELGHLSLAEQIDAAVADFQRRFPEHDQPVLISGHSAGAAYAGLYAVHYDATHEQDALQTAIFNPPLFTNAQLSPYLSGSTVMITGDDDILTQGQNARYSKYTSPFGPENWVTLQTDASNSQIEYGHSLEALRASQDAYIAQLQPEQTPHLASAPFSPFGGIAGVAEVAENNQQFNSCDAGQSYGVCAYVPDAREQENLFIS